MEKHVLEACAELGALQIKGRKPLAKKPSRKSRPQPAEAVSSQQLLFLVEGSTGQLQVFISP